MFMLSTGVSQSTLSPSTASSNCSIKFSLEGSPITAMASCQHLNISPDLLNIEKRLKELGQQTKETSTRSVTGAIVEDLQQLITQLKVEEWKNSRIPNLQLNLRRRSSNSQNASINDVTNFLHDLFNDEKFWCSIGPNFISLSNTYHGNLEKALSGENQNNSALFFAAERLLTQHIDTGIPQIAVLTGISGSGKSYVGLSLIKALFERSISLSKVEDFNKFAALQRVISLMSTCVTPYNKNCSKLGSFFEIQLDQREITSIKSHHIFLNQTRLVERNVAENNYNIFYAFLSGLGPKDLQALFLPNNNFNQYRYLASTNIIGSDEVNNLRSRYSLWSKSVKMIGLEEYEILRILCAILLLGNLGFGNTMSNTTLEQVLDGHKQHVVSSISTLLGVPQGSLAKALTNQNVTFSRSGSMLNMIGDDSVVRNNADSLAQALYTRVVNVVIKHGNSFNSFGSSRSKMSLSESILKSHPIKASNHPNFGFYQTSGYPNAGSFQRTLSFQSTQLPLQMENNFIGVLDFFGSTFSAGLDNSLNRLEQLCINLCTETIEYFFKTHCFKNVIENHREELSEPISVEFFDNGPIVDLISSQKSGILAVFDRHYSLLISSSCRRSFSQVTTAFKGSPGFKSDPRGQSFTIEHFTDDVCYDCEALVNDLERGISEDLLHLFHPKQCSFQLASKLFTNEMKIMENWSGASRGTLFRVTPISGTEAAQGEAVSFCQDFHYKLDSLLKVLVRSKPTFIRCIKTNSSNEVNSFDSNLVSLQVTGAQIAQMVSLTQSAFVYKCRYKHFVKQFEKLLFVERQRNLFQSIEDKASYIINLVEKSNLKICSGQIRGIAKRKHVFYTHSFAQQAEFCMISDLTTDIKTTAIVEPQSRNASKPSKRETKILNSDTETTATLTGMKNDTKWIKENVDSEVEELKKILGLTKRPQVPQSRKYSIIGQGSKKLDFPHVRKMVEDFPKSSKDGIPKRMGGKSSKGLQNSSSGTDSPFLFKGEIVHAIATVGSTPRQGRIVVVKDGATHYVPYISTLVA